MEENLKKEQQKKQEQPQQASGQTDKQKYGVTALILMLKGFFMGVADVIPGVSGGTIALIVGIYEELIETISGYDGQMLKLLFTGNWKMLLKRMNLGFLLPLVAGIGTAIFSLASVMTYLLTYHEALTFAAFFGLILGSVVLMSKDLKRTVSSFCFLAAGAALLFWLVGLLPVETPATPIAFFFSGMVAICAMILPGISGSFILLLLGKYKQIMAAVKSPFADNHILIILVFAAGALIGIIGFSKLLKWALKHYHDALFAFLIGMMLGSLRKLWPFSGVTSLFSGAAWARIGLMLMGFVVILVIHRIESCRAKKNCPLKKKN